MALAEATRAEIARARDRYPHPRSAILPALWAVQHELGYLSPEGMLEAFGRPSQAACTACFTGVYPVDIGEPEREKESAISS